MEKYNDVAKRDLLCKISSGVNGCAKTLLRGIVVTICDECNRACSFCPRGNGYKSPHQNKLMPLSSFHKMLRDLGDVYDGYISICGFGEPTLHHELSAFIQSCHEMCPRSRILLITNADSVDVLVNLPFVSNLEIQCSMYEQFSNNKIERLSMVRNKIVYKDILSDSMKYFNNKAGNSIRQNDKKLPIEQPCYLPFYKMSIDVNGDAILCCGDWRRQEILGNVLSQNIYDIWNGDRLNHIRQELLKCNRTGKICERCDADGTLCGEQIVEKWKEIYNGHK